MSFTSITSLTNTLRSWSVTSAKTAARPLSTSPSKLSPSPSTSASTSSPTSSNLLNQPSWTPNTQRTGVLARKQGMTCLWDQATGIRTPVTVLLLDDVQVLESTSTPATSTSPARHSVIVGCSPRREKTTSSAMLGQFRKAGIDPKMRVVEFPVTEDALVPAGTTLSAVHFVPGQHVDVQAPSIGKGFQGVMKRHGFAGLRASHGVSVSHRSHGSTGQHQDPGRVFPGKKMAGRMGGKMVTTQNLKVHRIDAQSNVLYVCGAVPGPPGGFVRIRDAKKKVGWKARARAAKGLGDEEVLVGITGFPMPGSKELAGLLPRDVVAGTWQDSRLTDKKLK